MKSIRGGLAIAVLTLVAVSGCASTTTAPDSATTSLSAAAGASTPTSAAADSQQLGQELAGQFFSILQRGDAPKLEEFLDPAFQIARTDGSTADKVQYLQQPAKVQAFQIDNVVTTRDGDLLVVRYDVVTEEVIDGKAYSSEPKPRLSVFIDDNDTWRLLAHANLSVPGSASTPAPAAVTPPLSDPADTEGRAFAERVQNEFFAALQNGDSTGLAALLSPAFQLVRADGSSADREQYLANPATLNSFELTDFSVTSTGDVFVARFLGKTAEVVSGVEYSRTVAPRFAVMKRAGESGQIVAVVNFNSPGS
jgi:hypothetical protein